MRSRVLTAIGLIPIVLGALFFASPWPFFVLAEVAAFICTLELSTLLKSKRVWIGWAIGAFLVLVPAVLPPGGAFLQTRYSPREWAVQSVLSLLCGIAVFPFALGYRPTGWPKSARWPGLTFACEVVAPTWYLLPFACLLRLHGTHSGLWDLADPALMAIVPLWGGDTAGIFVGKAFGRRLLAPKISPKKTVEGAIANLFACPLVSIPLGLAIGLSWEAGAACGLAAGTFGQLGDLFESYVKRQAGVKDSGSLLPGHGGLLDRVDSLLFTAPIVFAILNLIK